MEQATSAICDTVTLRGYASGSKVDSDGRLTLAKFAISNAISTSAPGVGFTPKPSQLGAGLGWCWLGLVRAWLGAGLGWCGLGLVLAWVGAGLGWCWLGLVLAWRSSLSTAAHSSPAPLTAARRPRRRVAGAPACSGCGR